MGTEPPDKASGLCPEGAGASGVSQRGHLMAVGGPRREGTCCLFELQAPTQQVWGSTCTSHRCPQVQSLLVPTLKAARECGSIQEENEAVHP